MSTSTLDMDNAFETDRKVDKGHGTSALGPSSSSDSGSDMVGIPDGDSDTDANGTGERASVEMDDMTSASKDIGVDRVQDMADDDLAEDDTLQSIDDEINADFAQALAEDDAADDEATERGDA